MPASRALQTPKTPVSTWERPFVVDRNIRHFVWYGGVAGEGLRSDGVDDLPLSKSICSILPIARHLRAGVSRTSHPALRVARDLEWCHHEYPRWGAHTSESTVTTLPVLGTPASIMGRSSHGGYVTGLRLFALPPVRAHNTRRYGHSSPAVLGCPGWGYAAYVGGM